MPDQNSEAIAVIGLHAKCRRNGVLPCAGGIMEQPALLMECFDLIDVAGEKEKQKQAEEAESNREKERMLLELKRGKRRG